MTAGRHHLHVDRDELGLVVHCLRCQVSERGTIPADPCPNADVAVACCAAERGLILEAEAAVQSTVNPELTPDRRTDAAAPHLPGGAS